MWNEKGAISPFQCKLKLLNKVHVNSPVVSGKIFQARALFQRNNSRLEDFEPDGELHDLFLNKACSQQAGLNLVSLNATMQCCWEAAQKPMAHFVPFVNFGIKGSWIPNKIEGTFQVVHDNPRSQDNGPTLFFMYVVGVNTYKRSSLGLYHLCWGTFRFQKSLRFWFLNNVPYVFFYYLDCAIGKGSISVFHKSNRVSQKK